MASAVRLKAREKGTKLRRKVSIIQEGLP